MNSDETQQDKETIEPDRPFQFHLSTLIGVALAVGGLMLAMTWIDDQLINTCIALTATAGVFGCFWTRKKPVEVRTLLVMTLMMGTFAFCFVACNGLFPSRMAANETFAARACLEFVEAQKLHCQSDPKNEYARSIRALHQSKPTLIPDGFVNAEFSRKAKPRAGYLFKVLTAQGRSATGGAMTYIDGNGLLTKRVALVAFPARYDRDGRNTFIVSTDGVVYQQDLRTDTEAIVSKMESFDPDQQTWVLTD